MAHRVPKSSALGMSIVGGVGMFSTSIFQPIIGGWIDSARAKGTAAGTYRRSAGISYRARCVIEDVDLPRHIDCAVYHIFLSGKKIQRRLQKVK